MQQMDFETLLAGAASARSLPPSAPAEELVFLRAVCVVMLASGAVAAASLLAGVTAPYGRYARGGWGPALPARLAWAVQESPVLAMVCLCLLRCEAAPGGPAAVLLALLAVHYFRRTVVYPLQIRGGKPTPLSIAAMAFAFCLANGYVQARHLTQFAAFPERWSTSPQFLAGLALFAAGFALNVHSDGVLLSLRRGAETGYVIPRRGLFRLVSAPHFLGEIVEWTGFAVAANSLPGLAFAAFTACNIGPRALQHHRWYLDKFDDYPRERRALIPFVW